MTESLRESVRLYLGNLRFTASERELRDFLFNFGEVKGVTIPVARDSGASRGYAFVEFWLSDVDVNELIASINGKEFCGRPIKAALAGSVEGHQRQDARMFPCAYIGNVDYEIEQHELREFLEQYTVLRNCRIITDRGTGMSRGFAFAECFDEEQLAVVLGLHGIDFRGRRLNIRRALDRPPREVSAK